MTEPSIVFDRVWKKFRRGERHDSLRDLIPALVGRCSRRGGDRSSTTRSSGRCRDVSFEVEAGQALGIIGPNGAGKSTTLKLLTRILKPTRGTSTVRGRVGALIEIAAGFHPDLTGRENVFLQGAIMGMRRAEIRRRFDEIVEFAGIGEFIDTPVKRYSSGMNARLGFAVAAHLDPDVLLIDEVLAVGDCQLPGEVLRAAQGVLRSGIAIVFVSHNLQAISTLCDRVLYLQPGGPPRTGTVGEMVTSYVTSDGSSADPRVSIEHATLSLTETGAVATVPVSPGTRLTLDLALTAHAELPRAGFALIVHRSDGLEVFNGSSMLDGEPTIDLALGSSPQISVTFRANTLRGTYAVSGLLVEEQRRWTSIDLGILGSFVVTETTRAGGVAELEPTYRLSVAGTQPAGRLATAQGH